MPIRRPDHGCHGYSSSRNSVLWAFSSLVVQHDQASRLNRIQATSTRGVRPCIRRVAGFATPTGSAGHAGTTANLKLTFHPDHSVGANQRMLLVTLTLIWALPVKAEVLRLSCDGTMKAEEEQAKPQAITKMGLIVNFDAGVVTGFTGITARIDEVNANSILFKGTTAHPSGLE